MADGDNTSQAATGQDDAGNQLIGHKLGHFQVISRIGHGGMGHVYRALDTSLQRYVAVKVLRGLGGGELDSVGEQRLMREAIAQVRVNHPNIVTIYYVGRENDTPFLAMELIDGQDVSALIKTGPLPYAQLSLIAMKITHALDVACQLGIVHADIKPQNLLVLPNGEVKLSDFGMARLTSDDTAPFGGTPNYLAPELLEGDSPTMFSDMYALGATLYEMTFQKLPVALSGTTVHEWSAAHSSRNIHFPEPWPDHLPTGWRNILQRLLAREPRDRFESYQQLGQELANILPSRAPLARPVPRAIAFVIDVISVSILLVLMQLAALPLRIVFQINEELVQSIAVLIAITLYTLGVCWWRQSLGRELLHIKVVNQFGLEPARRKIFLRCVLRMILFWGLGFSILLAWWPWLAIIVAAVAVVFAALDVLYLLIVGKGRSLHDLIIGTRVVAGFDQPA